MWEFRSEFNQADDRNDWRFAPQPNGSIVATSTLGDDGVGGAAVSALLARNRLGVFEPTTHASSVRAGSRVTVLLRGTLRHGAATLWCVRVHGGVESLGWAFVTDAERAQCTPIVR